MKEPDNQETSKNKGNNSEGTETGAKPSGDLIRRDRFHGDQRITLETQLSQLRGNTGVDTGGIATRTRSQQQAFQTLAEDDEVAPAGTLQQIAKDIVTDLIAGSISDNKPEDHGGSDNPHSSDPNLERQPITQPQPRQQPLPRPQPRPQPRLQPLARPRPQQGPQLNPQKDNYHNHDLNHNVDHDHDHNHNRNHNCNHNHDHNYDLEQKH